jgi:excisionase family DNA binding protein
VDEEQYLTVQDAAKELGLAETTIRTSLSKGRLPHRMLFGRKLIARADMETYRQRTQPSGEKRIGRPKKQGETNLASQQDQAKVNEA